MPKCQKSCQAGRIRLPVSSCVWNIFPRHKSRTIPLQKPKYKLDENLEYIEEICKEPPDYYDKCSSKPCTRCSSHERCTEPPKTKIDVTKCGYKRHYIQEPSANAFEGDPLYGWSTLGAKGPNDEGPFSVVIMQPCGYPQAASIVLLNDAEPSKTFPTPPPVSSGLYKLNKFPNKRGLLLPDCPFRERQEECSTIGCPAYVTPGTFNPETGRYTPKRYFPPHFHKMTDFLTNKAQREDPGYTFEDCFMYTPDAYDDTRNVFGFCKEGPCGQKREIDKCMYVDCPAKIDPVKTVSEHEDRYKMLTPGGSDIRPGHVVIEHGISRQTCCFDDSISSMGGESVFSESTVSEISEGAEKEKNRIILHGETAEDDEPERYEFCRSMVDSINLYRKSRARPQEALARTRAEYVPHRRCTWKDRGETDAACVGNEARECAKNLDAIFNRGIAEPDKEIMGEFYDPKESHRASTAILDGILGFGEKVETSNDFESHEPPDAEQSREVEKNGKTTQKSKVLSQKERTSSQLSESIRNSELSRDTSKSSNNARQVIIKGHAW